MYGITILITIAGVVVVVSSHLNCTSYGAPKCNEFEVRVVGKPRRDRFCRPWHTPTWQSKKLRQCICKRGYVRNSWGDCVPWKKCIRCKCRRQKDWNLCASGCPVACNKTIAASCSRTCVPGCDCPPGWVIDPKNWRKCVKVKNCLPVCPPHSRFEPCVYSCRPKCGMSTPKKCNITCYRGDCVCDKGFAEFERNGNKICVRQKNCDWYLRTKPFFTLNETGHASSGGSAGGFAHHPEGVIGSLGGVTTAPESTLSPGAAGSMGSSNGTYTLGTTLSGGSGVGALGVGVGTMTSIPLPSVGTNGVAVNTTGTPTSLAVGYGGASENARGASASVFAGSGTVSGRAGTVAFSSRRNTDIGISPAGTLSLLSAGSGGAEATIGGAVTRPLAGSDTVTGAFDAAPLPSAETNGVGTSTRGTFPSLSVGHGGVNIGLGGALTPASVGLSTVSAGVGTIREVSPVSAGTSRAGVSTLGTLPHFTAGPSGGDVSSGNMLPAGTGRVGVSVNSAGAVLPVSSATATAGISRSGTLPSPYTEHGRMGVDIGGMSSPAYTGYSSAGTSVGASSMLSPHPTRPGAHGNGALLPVSSVSGGAGVSSHMSSTSPRTPGGAHPASVTVNTEGTSSSLPGVVAVGSTVTNLGSMHSGGSPRFPGSGVATHTGSTLTPIPTLFGGPGARIATGSATLIANGSFLAPSARVNIAGAPSTSTARLDTGDVRVLPTGTPAAVTGTLEGIGIIVSPQNPSSSLTASSDGNGTRAEESGAHSSGTETHGAGTFRVHGTSTHSPGDAVRGDNNGSATLTRGMRQPGTMGAFPAGIFTDARNTGPLRNFGYGGAFRSGYRLATPFPGGPAYRIPGSALYLRRPYFSTAAAGNGNSGLRIRPGGPYSVGSALYDRSVFWRFPEFFSMYPGGVDSGERPPLNETLEEPAENAPTPGTLRDEHR